MRQLNCIMLIDDNKIDNFFHERVIRKNNASSHVIAKESGREALDYLMNCSSVLPELIFLDINMPGMNGWEFISHYKNLDCKLQTSMIVVMIGTPDAPDEQAIAHTQGILADFKTKPLTKEMLEQVIDKLDCAK
ncbi:response regulator [Flavobacterium sp. LaA7.5]|nr:response regulator [Flavobacterium salilacus subsp. altitudinum]